jgi:gliding motility-associated-like protein
VEGDVVVLRSTLPTGIKGGRITADRFAFDRADTRIVFPFFNQLSDGPFAQGVVEQYCYTFAVSDTCGNISTAPSRTCAVFLQGGGDEQPIRRLTWSPFVGFDTTNVFSYTVEKLSPEGSVIRSVSRGALLEYSDSDFEPGFQNITYRIRVAGPTGMPVVYSNAIVLKQRSTLFVPTAFSPNGDGVNDEFFVQSKFIRQFRMVIYSKQGELLYQSTNPDERWNGTLMGRELPPDVYIFAIEARDENNKPFTEKGSITLIK